jgi:serine/threonine-protein kinase
MPKPAPAAGRPPPDAASPEPLVNANQELAAGTTICARYKVERILGRGGMGAVYAVHHINTGEALALKVLNPALASNAQAVERFRTEARAPVRIGTDHVVRIIDADISSELGGVPILVMERLQGRDLGTELKRRGAIPAGEVVLYFRQVARALDKAHSINIVHRDLKPANLYLTQRDDGSPLVKILDFGIAKLTDGISAELTQDGTIFGTPWYMSPEQARGQASKVGPPADLWALGLIAFRLLTGQNYWSAEGMAALIGQILYDPMPPPTQLAPHLGPRFDEWFARACNREIDQRFPTAAELVARLAEALGVSFAPQLTGQLDASNFPGAAYPTGSMQGMSFSGLPGGMSASGQQPAGMSASGQQPGAMSASGQQPGAMSASGQQPGALSASGQQPGNLSQTPMSATPVPAASLSASGAPVSAGGSTGSPLTATQPPFPVSARPSNVLPVAMGLLIAVLVAGGATAAFLVFGRKPAPVAAAAAKPPESAPAVSAALSAPAPEPSAVPSATVAAVEPPPSAVPSAVPSATVAAVEPPPTAVAVAVPAKAPPTAAPKPGTTTPPPAKTSTPAKPPTKAAPKVDKVVF